ncbi:gastrula zinc finger protein XlCGF26.1-like isoform X3 [Schistocerca gregaria]|uniref:gastrula zinc finger protein XlCGF26.1-like isoform X3 n=1 Tax=Schistocerca gregaria TaxID=7010 RepID=UPI00211EA246|nr:gastrula zinc finger protein XlCGF26.1-like isoform X3 [Schistocerca gregaria]
MSTDLCFLYLMDIVTSEGRRSQERMILEGLLRNGEITVKEEVLITTSLVPVLPTHIINVKEERGTRTPPPPITKTEVIDLVDEEEDNGGDDARSHDGMDITSQPPVVADFLTIDLEEESGTVTSPLASDSIEGNAAPQHSTVKQLDAPHSVMCNPSVPSPLRLLETNNEDSLAHELKCSEPIRIDPPSKSNQTSNDSNTAQEPQCLGPFEESSCVKCPKCSMVLTGYFQILSHRCVCIYLCSETVKKKIKCFFCVKEYSTVRSLKKHIKTYVQKTYVKCSICGLRLTSESSFRTHALTHTNQWPYRCDICGQGSVSEYQLENHKATHAKEKSWMCDVCGAMFHNHARLRSHKMVHSERKHECDLCYAKFRERYQLNEHKRKVHSAVKIKFQCEHCSSAFTSKHQLKYHIEMKHDDNFGGESFICSVCNKEFKHRFAFNRHMYKHKYQNENVIYTCDMCKRNFAQKSSLTRHILEHNGKQFSCTHCGMLFTQRSSVKRHMLKSHFSDR